MITVKEFFENLVSDKRRFAYLVVVVLSLPLALYLVKNPTLLSSKASEEAIAIADQAKVDQLTEKLEKSTEKKESSGIENAFNFLFNRKNQTLPPEELVKIAREREEILNTLIEKDPEILIRKQISPELREKLPDNVKQYLEKQIVVNGTLTAIHIDSKDKDQTSVAYRLADLNQDQKDYQVVFIKNPPEEAAGSIVKAEGLATSSVLVVDNSEEKDLEVVVPVANTDTTGEHTVGVVKVNIKGVNYQRASDDQIRDAIFLNPKFDGSVNSFIKESSGGRLKLTGDIVGEVNLDAISNQCDFYSYIDPVDDQLKKQGKDINSYRRIIYLLPNMSCPYSGWGTIGNNPSRAWIVGGETNVYLISHELGHNLGLQHANSLSCSGGKSIDEMDKCNSEEYGDGSDVMGYKLAQFNAPHKADLNWFNPTEVQVVSNNGIYKIAPLEASSSAGVKVLKVSKSDTNDTYYNRTDYYLSYRQPIGTDGVLDKIFTEGASIHFASTVPSIQTNILSPVLKDGQSLYDGINDITITQLSHDSTGVTVDLKFGPLTVLCPDVNFVDFPDQIVADLGFNPTIITQGGLNSGYVTLYNDGNLISPSLGKQLSENKFSWKIDNLGSFWYHNLKFKVNDWNAYQISSAGKPPIRLCGVKQYSSQSRFSVDYTFSQSILKEDEPFSLTITPNPDLRPGAYDYVALIVDGLVERLDLESESPPKYSWHSSGLSSGYHYVLLVSHCKYPATSGGDIDCSGSDIYFNYQDFIVEPNQNYASYLFSPSPPKAGDIVTIKAKPGMTINPNTYPNVALLIDGKTKRLEWDSTDPVVFKWVTNNSYDGESLGRGNHTVQLVARCEYVINDLLKSGVPTDCSKSSFKFSKDSFQIE